MKRVPVFSPEPPSSIEQAFIHLLQNHQTEFSAHQPFPHYGIAVSGGVDSLALAIVASQLQQKSIAQFTVLHIHHGLQKIADDWRVMVEAWCADLGLKCLVQHVKVQSSDTRLLGEEGAARKARYEALELQAKSLGLQGVFFGHHQNDQAETILMRIFRGTGARGLCGIQPMVQLAGFVALRPWLSITKSRLNDFVMQHPAALLYGVAMDPTNHSERYTRGWIRSHLTPVLERFAPQYMQNIDRLRMHMLAETQVLDEYMRVLEKQIVVDEAATCLRVPFLSQSKSTQAVFLRYWFVHTLGFTLLPTTAVLEELLRQIRFAATPTRFFMDSGEIHILRTTFSWVAEASNSLVHAVPQKEVAVIQHAKQLSDTVEVADIPIEGILMGKEAFVFQSWTITFKRESQTGSLGLSEDWLQGKRCRITTRRPQHGIKIDLQRPRKKMKHLFQELSIPDWQRRTTVYIWIGEVIVYISGIGWTAEMPLVPMGIGIHCTSH